jgi:hypothetical protein
MTVTYQVGGGGHLDIDFWVCLSLAECRAIAHELVQIVEPGDKVLAKHIKQGTGTISITAAIDGRHEYCFSNQMSAVADKVVRYAVEHSLQSLCLTSHSDSASTFMA